MWGIETFETPGMLFLNAGLLSRIYKSNTGANAEANSQHLVDDTHHLKVRSGHQGETVFSHHEATLTMGGGIHVL